MKYLTLSLSLLLSLVVVSCSDDSSPVNPDPDPDTETNAQYVIAARPTALEDAADYLLTTESLTEGSLSTLGNGIEQDGYFRYYVTSSNKLFSLLYGQGGPGAVTTYQLSRSGELEERSDFQSETVQAFAAVDDDILMMDIPRNISDLTSYWYRLDTKTSQFVNEGQINIVKLAGNGEMAHFNWLTQIGNYVFAPYFSITGQGNNIFSTQYPDSAWVAVFSYPDMELETVITDDRTSFIGRYMTQGLSVDENGDVYAFSSATAMNDSNEMNSDKPSAITRINAGEMEFDRDYFFNIEEASGGYALTDHVYASNGNVLLLMQDANNKDPWGTGHRLAVVNVYDQSFSWVDGLPEVKDVVNVLGDESASVDSYVSEDGSTVYTGITIGTTTENEEGEEEDVVEGSYVYAIDIATVTATQGVEVEGGVIDAIKRLEPIEE